MNTLYQRILRERYAMMPQAVQTFHSHAVNTTYRGTCNVQRGNGFISNLCASLLSLPKTGNNVEVTVALHADGKCEIWNRWFNGKRFRSVQWQQGDKLYERLNFTTLVFDIITDANKLELDLQKMYVLGIPMMKCLRPNVMAIETDENGVFQFHIRTSLPLIGLLVEYKGRLTPAA